MSQSLDRFNDGSANPPRLRAHQSLWGLLQLPMNTETEWTIDEKFRRVKEAGFEGMEIVTRDFSDELMEAYRKYDLRIVTLVTDSDISVAIKSAEIAAKMGSDYIWLHPMTAFDPLDDVVKLIVELRKAVNDLGLSFFVETHRNTFTETLPQCLQLIERIPDIRFTADLSHFVLVGEFYGWEDERAVDKLMPILERTSHLHGRISSGEQVQVDVGNGSGQTAQFFVTLWETAIRHWLKGAGPGDILPFASELGPPRYACTLPDGREYSDRWEQGLIMKKLAEQAWAQACS